jgi:hypothetical protein
MLNRPWNETNFIMGYDLFDMLLNKIFANILLRIFAFMAIKEIGL